MIEPINPFKLFQIPQADSQKAVCSKKNEIPIKDELYAAEQEVASLYYVTSLRTLSASLDQPEKKLAANAAEKKSVEKSFLGRAKDWLWGIFGWGQKQPVSEVEANPELSEQTDQIASEDLAADGTPRLEAPSAGDRKQLSDAIAKLNRELVNRLKDMAEFEEEMRKSSSGELDKLIFLHLVNSSIDQKKLKESSTLIAHDHLVELHQKNQKLRKAHFELVDAIISENKARGVLKWINVGLTAFIVGGTAIAFAVGGPLSIFAVGLPLSYLGKGVVSLSDGILKYRNDLKTGELVTIRQETKMTSSEKRERLSDMQTHNEDIATLLKLIRHHLENQTKAERSNFARNIT